MTSKRWVSVIAFASIDDNAIANFDNNTLPGLVLLNLSNSDGSALQLKSFSGNYLGKVTELPSFVGAPLMTFSQNTIPLIKTVDLSNTSLTAFQDNRLPELSVLRLSNTFLSIFKGYNLSKLASLELNDCGLVKFEENNLPALQSLQINGNVLKTFGKSQMPALTYLSVKQNYFSNISELL